MSNEHSRSSGQAPPGVWVLGVAFVVLEVFSLIVGLQDEPNVLATLILQGVTVFFGLWASWLFGRGSVESAARELNAPRARAAMRHAITNYRLIDTHALHLDRAMKRLSESKVEGDNGVEVVDFHVAEGLLMLAQSHAADDARRASEAVAGWVDLAPDVAEALKAESADDFREAEAIRED